MANRERDESWKRLRRDYSDGTALAFCPGSSDNHILQRKRFETYDRDRLPEGWLDCPPFGRAIGYLVPSKVPLGESFNCSIPPGKRYSFGQVIQQNRDLNREIGLVVDLTNTSRYYSTSNMTSGRGEIKHVKIHCVGRDAVPSNAQVNKFVYEVDRFLSDNRHRNQYILVHCTHGHNRTGYMIVHYLMRSRPVSVTQAIKLFSDARPPGIYKPEYIEELYSFYHVKRPEMVVCPPMPVWKEYSDHRPVGEAVRPVHGGGVRMLNDDVIVDEIPEERRDHFREYCYRALALNFGRSGCSRFPGSHPVSLNQENLQLLRQRYYYATWKADGTRYMMLVTVHGCYLIDRCFNLRRVQMRFPVRYDDCSSATTHHYTLLDGEMIVGTLPDSLKLERRYLVYDLMVINGVSVVDRPFHERWKIIDTEIIGPRNNERKNIHRSRNPHYRYDMEPFRVRRKDFWLLSAVTKLLKGFILSLSHAADGLILQGWDDPYIPRTHPGLLKWKYPEMNSVDFLFEVDGRGDGLLFLHERGEKKLTERNRVVFSGDLNPALLSGKIIECFWGSNSREWVCMRPRLDKSTPNEISTYQKVMQSIEDNITEDVLLRRIDEITQLPMYVDRCRHPKFRQDI